MIAPVVAVRRGNGRAEYRLPVENPFVRQAQIAMVPAFCTAMQRTGHELKAGS